MYCIAQSGDGTTHSWCLCPLLSVATLVSYSAHLKNDSAVASMYFSTYRFVACNFFPRRSTPVTCIATPQNFSRKFWQANSALPAFMRHIVSLRIDTPSQPHSCAKKAFGAVEYNQLLHTSEYMCTGKWRHVSHKE